MSNIVVHIPDDGWIRCTKDTMPEDKTICVVLMRYGNRSPEIMQWHEADNLCEVGCFMNVGEMWMMEANGCVGEWEPSFATFGCIELWKPLGLPEEENRRLLEDIEEKLSVMK